MRDGFLIGRFLKAYTSVYKYNTAYRPDQPSFDSRVLAARFAARARRFRTERQRYGFHLQVGFIAALLFLVTAFQVHLWPDGIDAYAPMEQEVVTMEEIVQTQQQVTPPPPPRPPIPVEVPNDEILEDDDLDLDATLDITEPLAALPPPPPPAEEPVEEEEPEIFVVVEQMPEMIGGFEALLKDLEYPVIAQRAGIEGTVVVNVVIDEEGRPVGTDVVKSGGEALDKAAVAAVMKQRFKPGRQRNRPVRVVMAIPVHFRLRAQ